MYGAEIAKELIDKYKNTRPVLMYGDPDVDGLISLLFLCQLGDMLGIDYTYYVNEKRQHGFVLEPEKLRGYLVISADFCVTEEVMRKLVENDVVVVSTDHHEVQDTFIDIVNEETGARGIVINNQYPFEPVDNQYQSGAGVFYELMCDIYPEFKSDEREALVGLTLLSDARPIENDKARAYLKKTFNSNPQQGYIGYLISNTLDADYNFGVPRLDRNYIDYTLAPHINSLLRFDRLDEAVNFILGQGLQSKTAKTKQADLVLAMKARASYLEMQNITVIGVAADAFPDFPNVDITNFIGLLCSNIKGAGKSVLGFVYDNGVVTRASFRGQYDDVHYRTGFRELGINAQGHAGAFGILDFHPTAETWKDIDTLVGTLNEGHIVSAKIIDTQNLSFVMMQSGLKIATDNCYVRDMYRTYIRYKGIGAKIVKQTYRKVPFTQEDSFAGLQPDEVSKGTSWKYLRDSEGNPIPKYIQYSVDGKQVKSFGVKIEDGLILPILEKGHVQLYIRENVT